MRKLFNPGRLDIEGYSGNKLKDLIQNDVNNVLDREGEVVAEITTGFGKTNIAMIAIKKRLNKLIHIVVPTENLVDQWKTRLSDKGLTSSRIQIYVINTYTMSNKVDGIPDFLIVDETHRCLNKDSMYFSQLLDYAPNAEKLLLSASLDVKHKAFLDELNICTYYVVTRNWAFRQGLVPYHTAMNVPVDLTPVEMSDYLVAQDTIESQSRWFSSLGVYDAYRPYNAESLAARRGIPVGAIYGKMKKWRNAIDARRHILYNASNKQVILSEMIPYVSEKCMIFAKTIDYVKKLVEQDELGIAYHSKLRAAEKREALKAFMNNLYPHIYSVDSLKEGVDVPPDCRLVFRMAYEKGERDTIQITGRASRFDENNLEKESYLINFYVRNFKARGKEVESKELYWLTENQKSEYNVIWFEEADDAINFVKEKFGNDA